MRMPEGYDTERAAISGEFETLVPGGYVCKIKAAKEETAKTGTRQLAIAFDIAEGENTGFFEREYQRGLRNGDENWPFRGTFFMRTGTRLSRCTKMVSIVLPAAPAGM